MNSPQGGVWSAGVFVVACTLATIPLKAADITAAPEEAGLRAAIAAAQPGDKVHLVSSVLLSAPVRIDKAITLYTQPSQNYRIFLHGFLDTELLQVGSDGIVLEGLRLLGYSRANGVLAEKPLLLRDCIIENCREPVRDAFWQSGGALRLERVTINANQQGLNCFRLEANDSIFSYNQLDGITAGYALLDGCRFEHNGVNGAQFANGRVRNCVFRYNGYYGLRCDPDSGVLSVSSSVFYANTGGGLFLGEKLTANIDNCTVTRHTGAAAIEISQSTELLFRHCTIADNVVVNEPGAGPPSPQGAFIIGTFGKVELQNCIVADNPTNGSPHAAGLVGPWVDGGGNIIGGPARLGVIQDNGGPTHSLMPLPDSPAIDAGRPSDVMVDARGLSRIAGSAPDAGAIEVGAEPLADTDKDGLPDLWERLYGLNPTNANDSSLDSDGDGHNALTEYNFRTDPGNSQSVHRIHLGSFTWPHDPGIQVTWTRIPGIEYQVETSTDLQTWRKVASTPPYRPNGGVHNLQYAAPAEVGTLFYRVTIVP